MCEKPPQFFTCYFCCPMCNKQRITLCRYCKLCVCCCCCVIEVPPPLPPMPCSPHPVYVPVFYPVVSQNCCLPRCPPCLPMECTPDPCAITCPWPFAKSIHRNGSPLVPGYQGHIPGFRHHGAARTFGNATRDTCCIMSQWGDACPQLPHRIFEQ